jgi:hypothetical protein
MKACKDSLAKIGKIFSSNECTITIKNDVLLTRKYIKN